MGDWVRMHQTLLMSDRRALVVTTAWLLGAAWILIPHPYEGPVVVVLSERYGIGIHRSDALGVVLPIIVSVIVATRRPH